MTTVDWPALIVYLGGGGALAIAAVLLVRRSERRLGNGPDVAQSSGAPGVGGEDPVSAYLDRMSGELRLPAADVAEVRAELADHLADSIASLEAEGFERERAIREALARLGSADELGRHLRAAHQSTRRLLAGVGGGVFAAGGGFVLGYFGGIFVALLGLLAVAVIAALLTLIGVPLPDLMAGDRSGNAINSLLSAVTVMVAAGTATRYAVRTSAGLSRHNPRSIAHFWAVAAALVFGWLALFGLRGPQSWAGVAAELCIPVVAVAAALVGIERPMPHVGRWAVVIGGISLVGSVLMLGALGIATTHSGSGSSQATEFQFADLHFDSVAPMAPAEWLPHTYGFGGGYGSESQTSGTWVTADMPPNLSASAIATLLANWKELRFEAWHGLLGNPPEPFGIDTSYSGPFATQPAVLYGTYLSARFHFERMRDAGSWWIFLTGVGPDGHRYRLDNGEGGQSSFNGSAWDWLTASQ